MERTFWNKEYNNELANALMALIPVGGTVTAKGSTALEAFRKMANFQYDLYNNGLCNYGNYSGDYRLACRVFGFKPLLKGDLINIKNRKDRFVTKGCEEFEQQMRYGFWRAVVEQEMLGKLNFTTAVQ